jgi:hypothetical protein
MHYNFTIDLVTEENSKLHKEFQKKYSKNKNSQQARNESMFIQEAVRGLYVLEKWNREGRNGSPLAMLKFYSMPEEVMKRFVETYLPEVKEKVSEAAKPEKRKDKWSSFDSWAKEHQGEQFTTEQLTEIAGFSYQTVLKYISESPLVKKIKKGIWEISITPERTK